MRAFETAQTATMHALNKSGASVTKIQTEAGEKLLKINSNPTSAIGRMAKYYLRHDAEIYLTPWGRRNDGAFAIMEHNPDPGSATTYAIFFPPEVFVNRLSASIINPQTPQAIDGLLTEVHERGHLKNMRQANRTGNSVAFTHISSNEQSATTGGLGGYRASYLDEIPQALREVRLCLRLLARSHHFSPIRDEKLRTIIAEKLALTAHLITNSDSAISGAIIANQHHTTKIFAEPYEFGLNHTVQYSYRKSTFEIGIKIDGRVTDAAIEKQLVNALEFVAGNHTKWRSLYARAIEQFGISVPLGNCAMAA